MAIGSMMCTRLSLAFEVLASAWGASHDRMALFGQVDGD